MLSKSGAQGESAEVMRWGYAVEYDYAPPTQLHPTLETKPVAGFTSPGKSTAPPGMRKLPLRASSRASTPHLNWRASRHSFWIGVRLTSAFLSTTSSRRAWTSRTACSRRGPSIGSCFGTTTPTADSTRIGRRVGSVSNSEWDRFERKEEGSAAAFRRNCGKNRSGGDSLATWLRRTGVEWANLCERIPVAAGVGRPLEVVEQVVLEAKYGGYIRPAGRWGGTLPAIGEPAHSVEFRLHAPLRNSATRAREAESSPTDKSGSGEPHQPASPPLTSQCCCFIWNE